MIWNTKRLSAECVGTFALVLVGTGAIVVNNVYDGVVTHTGISVAFGGIVTLMILAFGKWSGAHINPAVTLGFWMAKLFPTKEVLPYLTAQIIGATFASAILYLLFPMDEYLGATLPAAGVANTFLLELGLTFMLMLVILVFSQGTANLSKFTAWAVGLTVGLEAYFAGPYTGASMNPARSIAPALISGHLEHAWIYILSTAIGAMLIGYIWNILKSSKSQN